MSKKKVNNYRLAISVCSVLVLAIIANSLVDGDLITGMATISGTGDKGVSTDGIGCDFCLGDVESGLCINNGGTDGWCDWQNRDSGDKDYNYMHQAPTGEKWVTGDFVFVTREGQWKGNIFNAREYLQEELVGVDIDGKIITQMFELDDNGLFSVINSGKTSEIFLNILQDEFYVCFVDGTCLDLSYFESFPPYQGATCVAYSGGPRFREALMFPRYDVGVSGFDIKCTLSGIYNSGPKYFVSVGGCVNDAECGYDKKCNSGDCESLDDGSCISPKAVPISLNYIKLPSSGVDSYSPAELISMVGESGQNEIVIGNDLVRYIGDQNIYVDFADDCYPAVGDCNDDCSGYCLWDSVICLRDGFSKCEFVGNKCELKCRVENLNAGCLTKTECLAFNGILETVSTWWPFNLDTKAEGAGCCPAGYVWDSTYGGGVGICKQNSAGTCSFSDILKSPIVSSMFRKSGGSQVYNEYCADMGSIMYGIWATLESSIYQAY